MTHDKTQAALDALDNSIEGGAFCINFPQEYQTIRHALTEHAALKERNSALETTNRELLEALEKIVHLYVANIGTDSEFIKCITPHQAHEMTITQRRKDKIWSAFDKAREVIAKAKGTNHD